MAEGSEGIELLSPFDAWSGGEFGGLRVLLKAVGKCTTDHISAAGPWLRYRGHLTNICGNLYAGAVNAFSAETGYGPDILDDGAEYTLPDLAKRWKAVGQDWLVVGDENLGEGSSREHAAMEPRYMGARAIVVKSFARIHETNLKKQGVLPLTFRNPADYDLVQATAVVATEGVTSLAPDSTVTLVLTHEDGSVDRVACDHSLNEEQIAWFQAGSALNKIRASR